VQSKVTEWIVLDVLEDVHCHGGASAST